MRRAILAGIGSLLGVAIWLQGCHLGPPPFMPDLGHTQLAQGAEIRADQQTVDDILATFTRADDALHRQDLDVLMTLYSEGYRYQGLTKANLRNLWEDLFRQYHDFSSTHIFSQITVKSERVPQTAEITCTGGLWAISNQTGQRVNLDSWFSEVHYLIYEQGAWRIRGHAWENPKAPRMVIAPHPFF